MNARDFFRPPWVRALAVGLAVAWTLFELWRGDLFWVLLGLATTALAWWEFFGAGEYGEGGRTRRR